MKRKEVAISVAIIMLHGIILAFQHLPPSYTTFI